MPISIGFPDGLPHIYPHLPFQKTYEIPKFQLSFSKPTQFYRFTGLEAGEFLNLKEEIEPLWKKAETKRLPRIRVKVKQAILKWKRFKILKEVYRHSFLKDYYLRFQIIAGIINFQGGNNLNPIYLSLFIRETTLSRV